MRVFSFPRPHTRAASALNPAAFRHRALLAPEPRPRLVFDPRPRRLLFVPNQRARDANASASIPRPSLSPRNRPGTSRASSSNRRPRMASSAPPQRAPRSALLRLPRPRASAASGSCWVPPKFVRAPRSRTARPSPPLHRSCGYCLRTTTSKTTSPCPLLTRDMRAPCHIMNSSLEIKHSRS